MKLVRACCTGGPLCGADIGQVLNANDGSSDNWEERPWPTGTGYPIAADNCGELWLNLSWAPSTLQEIVQVDDVRVSGVSTLWLPILDLGDGTYETSVRVTTPQSLIIDCAWAHAEGLVQDSTTIDFN